MDVAGPMDVFAEANHILHRQVYQPEIIGLEHHSLVASSGIKIIADSVLSDAVTNKEATLLLAGAPEAEQ